MDLGSLGDQVGVGDVVHVYYGVDSAPAAGIVTAVGNQQTISCSVLVPDTTQLAPENGVAYMHGDERLLRRALENQTAIWAFPDKHLRQLLGSTE